MRIAYVVLSANIVYFPRVPRRHVGVVESHATAPFHPLMANEVSVATLVSKTTACKPEKPRLSISFTYMLCFGESRLPFYG